MTDRCANCECYQIGEGNYGECWFTPPASIAAALGLPSPYEVDPARVHDDWSCSLFKEREE